MQSKGINLNTASYEELAQELQISDRKAQYILENRPYSNWDDFRKKVPDLPDSTVSDLKRGNAVIE
ncbi:MAG: helix-hairpin-helix domain-containing protein [Fibrobacter sp.]|nr:helix-hairpin-helix domain-containing protein [Fibrobacter sp.]